MKNILKLLLVLFTFSTLATSCRDVKDNKAEDAIEEVEDGVEDAADEVEDAVE